MDVPGIAPFDRRHLFHRDSWPVPPGTCPFERFHCDVLELAAGMTSVFFADAFYAGAVCVDFRLAPCEDRPQPVNGIFRF